MHLLGLQGQDCTCMLIVHAADVRFPSRSGVASHFRVSFTGGCSQYVSILTGASSMTRR